MNEATLIPDQLLTTKFFVPQAPPALIPRPRLTTLLDDSLQRKLTLVSAPAGFGKTTLLAEWLSQLQIADCRLQTHEASNLQSTIDNLQSPRLAWLSLEEADNNLVRFWTYLLSALDRCCPGSAAPLLSCLQAHHPPIQHLLTALINALLDIPEPVLLVLDDYQVVSEPAIHTSLAFLLEHLPPQVHLMVLARSDPPLGLPRLRARGQVLELRTDQLRCTPEEAQTFLGRLMRVALPPDLLHQAIARCEGWLVGLQLLGLWLQNTADRGDLLSQLSGSHPYIVDYLTEEVLERQPHEVQTFLLHTAFLERLCASLCDAVIDDVGLTMYDVRLSDDAEHIVNRKTEIVNSQEMLEQLERSNLFVVPLDAQRGWYRYHPLFAEALRYRLEQTQPEQVTLLHARASRWYADHGQTSDAIEHALLAQDWPWAADLIEQYRCDIGLAELESDLLELRRWMERLPKQLVRARPRLCLLYARSLLPTMRPAAIDPWLMAAENTLRATLEAQTRAEEHGADAGHVQEDLLGEVVAFRALLVSLEGDGREALSLCQQALAHLSPRNLAGRAGVAYIQAMAYAALHQAALALERTQEAAALARTVGDAARASRSTAIVAMSFVARQLQLQGQLHTAWRLLHQAAQLGETPQGIRCASVCWVYTIQADILRAWNRLDEAQTMANRAIQINEWLGAPLLQGVSSVVLARIEHARGNWDAAQAAARQAEQIAAQQPFSQFLAYRVLELAQLWPADGAAARAAFWAEQLSQAHDQRLPAAHDQAQLALSRVALAEGQAEQVLSRLAPLLEQARTSERWGSAIEALVLQALAYQLQHDHHRALSALAEAVRWAELQGSIRVFVDEGAPLAALLAQLHELERRRGSTPYLDTLLAAFPDCKLQIADCRLTAKQSAICNQQSAMVEPLSPRELEVLRLIAQGASNQEIAEELVLAVNTVKRHVSNIMAKLETANRTQAVAQARALGLLVDESSVRGQVLVVAPY